MSALSRDDVLRLAREAGNSQPDPLGLGAIDVAWLERFADLVAAAASDKARADYEREHCRHVVPLPDAIKVMIAEAVAAEREKWVRGARVQIPTAAMELEFASHYRRWKAAGIAAEREACAMILDANAEACGEAGVIRDVLKANAAAIRARGTE